MLPEHQAPPNRTLTRDHFDIHHRISARRRNDHAWRGPCRTRLAVLRRNADRVIAPAVIAAARQRNPKRNPRYHQKRSTMRNRAHAARYHRVRRSVSMAKRKVSIRQDPEADSPWEHAHQVRILKTAGRPPKVVA